jgi:lipopolysaccharide export LptBFGC system permease protein LptF
MKKIFTVVILFISTLIYSQSEFKSTISFITANNSIISAYNDFNYYMEYQQTESLSNDGQYKLITIDLKDKEKVIFVKDRRGNFVAVYVMFPNKDEYLQFLYKTLDDKFNYTKENTWINLDNNNVYYLDFKGSVCVLFVKSE